MNKLLIIFLVVMVSCNVNAQRKEDAKAVNWETPEMFTTKSISVKTDYIDLACDDCKYVEIKTSAGVQEYLLQVKVHILYPESQLLTSSMGA